MLNHSYLDIPNPVFDKISPFGDLISQIDDFFVVVCLLVNLL